MSARESLLAKIYRFVMGKGLEPLIAMIRTDAAVSYASEG